jgi:hypothetical protein
VDIGQNKDWSIRDFKEDQNTTIDGKEYVEFFSQQYYSDSKNCKTIQIPTKMDHNIHSLTCPNNSKQLCWHQLTT